jgi:hypothetical protein
MLIHDFVYVDAPYTAVRDRLARGAEAWLTPLAVRAGGDGEALAVRIGPAGAIPLLSRTARVCIGEPADRGDRALGRGLDRLLLHRMVQASVRSFLEGVASTLERSHASAPVEERCERSRPAGPSMVPPRRSFA